VLLVFQLGQPRIFFAMSRDGLLPKAVAKVHPKYRTPHVATIITGVGVAVVSMFTTLEGMVNLTNIGTLFAFMLVCIGVVILRVKDPNRPRPFRVPGPAWFLPVLGAGSCVGLAIYLPPDSWLRFFGWLAIGLVFYFLYGYRHSRLRHPAHVHAVGVPSHEVLHDFNPEQQLPKRDVDEEPKK
jgi:APA family basic amino acid/polyamine antiporter